MQGKARQLPHRPGVYQFLDRDGKILYIGKAKDLRKRVLSYFNKQGEGKTRLMLSKAVDVEAITVGNEVEALLLENRLINQHTPQYNLTLRESRRYAWIIVTDEEFPRIMTARDRKRRGNYYGPFTDGTARRAAVIALNKAFRLRTCRTMPKRVCLQYHIGNCTGPCEGHDTKEEYSDRVQAAQDVLKGKGKAVARKLEEKMRSAAAKQHYEEARNLRDALRAVNTITQEQVVERTADVDEDVVGSASNDKEQVYVVLNVRRGVIAKKREYRVSPDDDPEEFLTALYRQRIPPGEVITAGLSEEERAALEDYFSEIAGKGFRLTVPRRGEKKRLLDLAAENARIALEQEDSALNSLKDRLNLSAPPHTIDCFDVSTHHGDETVAACVRYRGGKPDPSMYRLFNIQNSAHDDFSAMAEAVKRRYSSDDLPDLIVVDGGKGQLSAARKALQKDAIAIIALAKREEEIFVPGLSFPLRMDKKDSGHLLLRRMRDAAHRFAISHHRGRRGKGMVVSALDHVQGIGPKRKQALYRRFKTFENIQKATKKQLQDILGDKTGERLHGSLHGRG